MSLGYGPRTFIEEGLKMKQFGIYELTQHNMNPKEKYKILHRLHRLLFKEYLPLLVSNRMTQCNFTHILKRIGAASYSNPLDPFGSSAIKVTLRK